MDSRASFCPVRTKKDRVRGAEGGQPCACPLCLARRSHVKRAVLRSCVTKKKRAACPAHDAHSRASKSLLVFNFISPHTAID